MRVFWEEGYEKRCMRDVVNDMGIDGKRLYDRFGDKDRLFVK
ncbi:TetR family transcriptional regulator [Paenibacillus xylanexedens]